MICYLTKGKFGGALKLMMWNRWGRREEEVAIRCPWGHVTEMPWLSDGIKLQVLEGASKGFECQGYTINPVSGRQTKCPFKGDLILIGWKE
jgi:hypothetical protein